MVNLNQKHRTMISSIQKMTQKSGMLKNIFSALVAMVALSQAASAQMIMRPGEAIKLDTVVNSLFEEIMPMLSPDRKTLYFVRSLSPSNTGGKEAGQDVWYSVVQQDGSWSRPFNLGVPINNDANNAVCGISNDGNTLYLTNVYLHKNKMEPGISFTRRDAGGVWTAPVALEIQDMSIQRGYLGGYMCPDEKTLFLTMKSDDAVGREDIYISTKQDDGKWSKPISLGKTINTVGFEISPFYVAADSMLYFASNGHGGAGDADIFRSKRQDESWTKWSKPENMGPQVNGDGFDAYLMIPYDSTAFFVKENPEVRYADIYTVILRDPARKAKEDSAAAALAKANRKKGDKDKSDKEKKGTDDDDRDPSEIIRELMNRKRLVNNEFESILFDFGSSKLRPESKRILERAAKYLKDHPTQGIELVGHTDNVDGEMVNQILSDKRSYAAKEYLMRKGISRNRILTHGFGKQIYAAENQSARGRQQNRRAEMNVLVDPEEFKMQYQKVEAKPLDEQVKEQQAPAPEPQKVEPARETPAPASKEPPKTAPKSQPKVTPKTSPKPAQPGGAKK